MSEHVCCGEIVSTHLPYSDDVQRSEMYQDLDLDIKWDAEESSELSGWCHVCSDARAAWIVLLKDRIILLEFV